MNINQNYEAVLQDLYWKREHVSTAIQALEKLMGRKPEAEEKEDDREPVLKAISTLPYLLL